MIEIKQLNVEHIRQIVLFDKTCFPTDFWKEEDWKELLEDPRAIYYALLGGDRIAIGITSCNLVLRKYTTKILYICAIYFLKISHENEKRGLAPLNNQRNQPSNRLYGRSNPSC